jgi:hypothetical protein
MSLVLPFAGPIISPGPALQFALWLALGRDPHDLRRPRIVQDRHGWDCNDYAYASVQALLSEGRAPCYVTCKTESGEQHMIAAYETQDGIVYARDNRVPEDVPLERLVAKGYTLEASADRHGEVWRAFA